MEINSQYNQICSSLFNNYSEEKIELLKSYITRITNNINEPNFIKLAIIVINAIDQNKGKLCLNESSKDILVFIEYE